MTHRTSIRTLLLVIGLGTAMASGQTPQQSFEEIYGAEAAKVAKSADTRDDAAFASKLLKYSEKLRDEPAMARMLLEKAYEFACKDGSGYALAIKAAREHIRLDPAGKEQWQEKVVAVFRLQYQRSTPAQKPQAGEALAGELVEAADALIQAGNYEQAFKILQEASRAAGKSPAAEEIAEKLKTAGTRLAQSKKLKDLVAKLAAKPDDDATAKSAALLCLVQLDDPAQAAKYAPASGDEAIKQFVPLAAKDPKDVSAEDALALADWLCSLAGKGETYCKISLLTRAKKCYEAVLVDHKKDVPGIAADRKLDDTLKKLARLHLGARKIVLDLGNGVTMKLALIPSGKVVAKDMSGKHPVVLAQPIYIALTEVTREQYQALMGGAGAKGEGGSLPAGDIQWEQAVEFCKKLAKKTGYTSRLPTEAEWEFAARAGSEGDFHFANPDDLGEYAWHEGNSGQAPHPVARKERNAFGLYDMLGNVWEWCGDSPADAPKPDPKKPPKDEDKGHATRGGSYQDAKYFCYCSSRVGRPRGFTNGTIGFRVAVESK